MPQSRCSRSATYDRNPAVTDGLRARNPAARWYVTPSTYVRAHCVPRTEGPTEGPDRTPGPHSLLIPSPAPIQP